jgi:methyl-accepting chemotaxis protein
MRFTVQKKLFGGFAAVLVLLVVLGIVATSQMGSVGARANALGEVVLPGVEIIKDIDGESMDYHGTQYERMVATNPREIASLTSHLAELKQTLADDFTRFGAHDIVSPEDRTLFDRVNGDWQSYLAKTADFVTLDNAHKDAQAQALLIGANPVYVDMQTAIDQWRALNDRFAAKSVRAAHSTLSSAKLLSYGLIALAVLLGGGIAYLIARGITGGVRQLRDASEGIATGDVDQTVEVRAKDEIGETAAAFGRMLDYLKGMVGAANRIADGDLTVEVEPASEHDALGHAFKTMVENLRSIVGEVRGAASSMSASSQQMAATSGEAGRAVGEIAHAVSDVASGAERQARMADRARESTQQTSESADRARELSGEGVDAAVQADEAMRAVRESSAAVTRAMTELAERSERIGGIVETITGIAGQTNLLALNAAIEAARAGEQGRGFAVVAEEVRKLAEESQQAAANIAELVGEIQGETQRALTVVEDGARKTEDGAAVVGRAREAFEAIGGAVEEMRSQIGQIVEAAAEVASVAEQSSASAEEVSASTEQTSASTQEIAASAQSLARTATELEELVSRFKITA